MKEKADLDNIFYIYYICKINLHFVYNRDNNFYLFYNIYLIKQDAFNYKMKL